MAKLVYALTGAGEWDVHRHGCPDVTRAENSLRYQQPTVPFEAGSAAEVIAEIVDDEMVELGYSRHDVNVFPCVKKALADEPVGYRFTQHDQPDGRWCRWSHVSVVAPGQRTQPGNRRCPAGCPNSDIEINPYADDQRYDPTLPDPEDD